MAEQLTLNQQVVGSSPTGVKNLREENPHKGGFFVAIQGAVSNLTATIIDVVMGIPIAL